MNNITQGRGHDLPQMTYGDNIFLNRPRDFRLLSAWQENGQLYCNLRAANLDDGPEYKALSYTWGPATRSEVKRLGSASENEQKTHAVVSFIILIIHLGVEYPPPPPPTFLEPEI